VGVEVDQGRDLVQGYGLLIDSCITQLKAQGPSRTCNESKDEREEFACMYEDAKWGLRLIEAERGFGVQGSGFRD